jgi:hypothetical protein
MANSEGEKMSIPLLKGKENWKIWHFKMLANFKSDDSYVDLIEGELMKPEEPAKAADESKSNSNYKTRSTQYQTDLTK